MTNVSVVARIPDGCHNRGIVDFLVFIKIIPSWIASSVIMGNVLAVFANGADQIPFHNLHVIYIVQQLDPRRFDTLNHFYPPPSQVTLIICMVHLAVQQFLPPDTRRLLLRLWQLAATPRL